MYVKLLDEEVDVRFIHYRFVFDTDSDFMRYSRKSGWFLDSLNDEGVRPTERGGQTICTITKSDGTCFVGGASCSKKDIFCYRKGRLISYGRAFNEFKNAKEIK